MGGFDRLDDIATALAAWMRSSPGDKGIADIFSEGADVENELQLLKSRLVSVALLRLRAGARAACDEVLLYGFACTRERMCLTRACTYLHKLPYALTVGTSAD